MTTDSKLYTLLEWVPYEGYSELMNNANVDEIRAYLKKQRSSRPNSFNTDYYWIVTNGPDPDSLLEEGS